MSRRRTGRSSRPGVLIIIQNLWVPFDRRVWLECMSLRDAGFEVVVVCPKGPDDPAYELLDGVHAYKYKGFPPITSKAAFPLEYAYSFLQTAWLVARARRRHRIDAIQACNPPDIFWPIAMVAKWRARTRFVFDQHDLCPELYESRFPDGPGVLHRALLWLERMTYRTADHVISTNESYRGRALGRGRRSPSDVTVVRTGPDPEKLRRGDPDLSLREGHRYLVAYLGVMGPQDGVDLAIRAAHVVRHDLGRTDVQFTFIGGGDCLEELRALTATLGLDDCVQFPGRLPDSVVKTILSTADLGLCPDPKNPLNDVSTMNKTMEYMSFGLPVVAFDLAETRVSGGDAAVYVEPNDVEQYAHAIVDLLDDPARRDAMAKLGRRRVEETLAWQHQRAAYVDVYRALLGDPAAVGAAVPGAAA